MNVASAVSFVWDTKPDFPSMYWQTENKNMSRIGVRHCSKLYMSKLKNVQTARKIIIFLRSSTDQIVKLDQSKIAKKEFLQNFK